MALGRFMQTDILNVDHSNPISFNRYAYVLNNPAGYVDPTGYAPQPTGEDTNGNVGKTSENETVAKNDSSGDKDSKLSDKDNKACTTCGDEKTSDEQAVQKKAYEEYYHSRRLGLHLSNLRKLRMTKEQLKNKYDQIVSENPDVNATLIWDQKTGHYELWEDGELIVSGDGYSGGNKGKVPVAENNPAYANVAFTGPAPKGTYVAEVEDGTRKWVKMHPHQKNSMLGRDGFYIHGGAGVYRDASQGCLIIQIEDRKKIKTGTTIWAI